MTAIKIIQLAEEELGFEVHGSSSSRLFFECDSNRSARIDFKRKIIYINESYIPHTQRFVIATCICFIRLNKHQKYSEHIKCSDIMYIRNYQVHSILALELLMPEEDFYKQWEKYNENIKALSIYFIVSDFACMFRANTLGLLTF